MMVATAQSNAQTHRVSGAGVVPIRPLFDTAERSQRIQALVQRVEALRQARPAAYRIRRKSPSPLRRPARATSYRSHHRKFGYLPEIVLGLLGLAAVGFLPVDDFSSLNDGAQLAVVFLIPFLLCAVVVGGSTLWRALWP